MHPRTRLLLVAACLSLAAPAVAAVWTNVGPGGGNVNIVTVDPVNPNNVYIVAALRAFKSTDAGLSWTPIEHPTGQLLLGEFVIDPSNPSTIYIPGAGSSVVKSTDGGATLTVHPMGIFPSGALAMDPTNPQHLWAAGYDTGKSAVAQSTDGGLTWTHVLMPGNVTSSLTVLAVDPLAPA